MKTILTKNGILNPNVIDYIYIQRHENKCYICAGLINDVAEVKITEIKGEKAEQPQKTS